MMDECLNVETEEEEKDRTLIELLREISDFDLAMTDGVDFNVPVNLDTVEEDVDRDKALRPTVILLIP